MDQRWGVGISGGSVERGNLTPDREALIYLGSPLGRAEPMPSWSKVAEMPLKADRNRWACRTDLKRFIPRCTVTLVSVGAVSSPVPGPGRLMEFSVLSRW